MFENFPFTTVQVRKYYQAAVKDLFLINQEKDPDIIFYLAYNIIIKTAMAVCAHNSLRVKSRTGHHIELIEKLAKFLSDRSIEDTANRMRTKRNRDLYNGGVATSEKEADFYRSFCQKLIKQSESHIFPKKML